MQSEVFAVPASGDRELVDAMNGFLRSHRVLHAERRLVEKEAQCFWTFCIEYLDGALPGPVLAGARKVDYKEVLTPDQFARFSVLRNLRKEIADQEAVPPYAVFTYEQLAHMVRLDSPSATALERIPGIGQAKMAGYGAAFLERLTEGTRATGHETGGAPAGADR